MKNHDEKKILLYSMQGGRCLACEKAFTIHELTIDHILPKKRTAKTSRRNPWWIDELFNLRLLCLNCHLLRRPHGFSDWDIEKINKEIDEEIDVDYTETLGEWIEHEPTKQLYKRAVVIYKTKKIFKKNNENT